MSEIRTCSCGYGYAPTLRTVYGSGGNMLNEKYFVDCCRCGSKTQVHAEPELARNEWHEMNRNSPFVDPPKPLYFTHDFLWN